MPLLIGSNRTLFLFIQDDLSPIFIFTTLDVQDQVLAGKGMDKTISVNRPSLVLVVIRDFLCVVLNDMSIFLNLVTLDIQHLSTLDVGKVTITINPESRIGKNALVKEKRKVFDITGCHCQSPSWTKQQSLQHFLWNHQRRPGRVRLTAKKCK